MPATALASIRIDRPKGAFSDTYLKLLKALLSIDFDQHDTRLKQCLEGARAEVETKTRLLLTQAQVTVTWTAFYDWEDLPHGPVSDEVKATDLSDNILSLTGPLTQLGDGDFPRLYGNFPTGLKLAYTGGYAEDTLPADLLDVVLKLAANNFDGGNRSTNGVLLAYHVGGWAS